MIVVHSIPDGSTALGDRSGRARARCRCRRIGVILEGLGLFCLCADRSFAGGRGLDGWHRSVSPGVKCGPYVEEERRRSGSQKDFLNGSNGSPPSWNAIHQERPTWRWGRHQAYQDWKP
jgi:hypothetical protein